MKKENSNSHTIMLRKVFWGTICLCAFFAFVSVTSCTHDPGEIVDPGPIDTTDNPIDTMDLDTPGIPCDPDLVYFDMQILPLLKSNCAKSGCHDAISHQDDIVLESYESLIASDIVDPFDLNGSDMYEVITESDPDKRMPQPPNQRLTGDQITLIAKWILQGAKDLTCDPVGGNCDTTNVSYSGFIAPLLATNCVGCHSGGAPSGGITLNTHAGVQAVANNGRLLGAITWANGFQPMPRGSAQLPSCSIDKIKAWIQDGAPNN